MGRLTRVKHIPEDPEETRKRIGIFVALQNGASPQEIVDEFKLEYEDALTRWKVFHPDEEHTQEIGR